MRFRQSSTVIRAIGLCSLVSDDVAQLAFGGFEVFVNYTVFELVDVPQFFARVSQAALDHVFGVLAAGAQTPLELADRGRHNEDADALRMQRAPLLRALPVDLEQQVVA